MKYHSSCHVSNDNCECPAGIGGSYGHYINNYSNGGGAKFNCFACGQSVCGNCSKIYEYYNFEKQRICDDCAEQHGLIKEKEDVTNL